MDRPFPLIQIKRYLKSHPIVAIFGPRQCGKTTLARMFCKQYEKLPAANYFDLESPIDLERLENSLLALKPLKGLIVIDEIQRRPDLFPILRFLVDQENLDQQYLILGSASRHLIKQTFESLAGRRGKDLRLKRSSKLRERILKSVFSGQLTVLPKLI